VLLVVAAVYVAVISRDIISSGSSSSGS
jgi:hypothetical protein